MFTSRTPSTTRNAFQLSMPANTPVPTQAPASRNAVPRHPSRYRITFTPNRLPLQTLYLDSVPALTRQPPRRSEICSSMALAHHPNCAHQQTPRAQVPCHVTTFGAPVPVATSPLKVCLRCLHLHERIADTLPNNMYASLPEPVTSTWTTVVITTVPTYYSLPPTPCPRDHNPPCPHSHCADVTNCTCNLAVPTTAITSGLDTTTCTHRHCSDVSNCTCTAQHECENLADHIMTMGEQHRLCFTAHCDNPSLHTAISDPTNPSLNACPDPSAHERHAPRASILSISQASWTMACYNHFATSEHAPTYRTTCSQLLDHWIAFHPQVAHQLPNVDLESHFPAMEHHANRAMLHVIYAFHSLQTLKARDTHLDHECRLLVCPLRTLASLRSGTNTLGSVGLASFLRILQSEMDTEFRRT
jgi:hypothetical protein